MSLTLIINGQSRTFAGLSSPAFLAQVIAEMNLKGDRIAVECNAEIVQRARWEETPVSSGDRLEVVHFVGGGAAPQEALRSPARRVILGEGQMENAEAGISLHHVLRPATIHNICYRTLLLSATRALALK